MLIVLEFLNQLLTAGIAITAFSLLLSALSFNLRDRVARSFLIILVCVMVVFFADAVSSSSESPLLEEDWLRFQWVAIIFLPPAYLHLSDALLATTGRPSRGRRKWAVRLNYLLAGFNLIALFMGWLVGPLVEDGMPAPHLQRTFLSSVFTVYYVAIMVWSGINFWRAYQRTVTRTSRRRMRYLIIGGLAPALGSYPYLLYGSGVAAAYPALFWSISLINDLMVAVLLVMMAYAVSFFGISWPDRVIKRRMFKWLMRGPVSASFVLGLTTIVRRVGGVYGVPYSAAVPVVMVGSLLLIEYAITLAAPIWERWLFNGGDLESMRMLQTLDERLLTTSDLRQFLESILAAICDRMQASYAFVAALEADGLEMIVTLGENAPLSEGLSENLMQVATRNGHGEEVFSWGSYWLIPFFQQKTEQRALIGILGVARNSHQELEADQRDALMILVDRAALALEDRALQQQVFSSLEDLAPQIDLIQRLGAAARYERTEVLSTPEVPLEDESLAQWVKDALTHYWGGPKLTSSPLMRLTVVQKALDEHEENPANALRAILRQAIDQVRPEGERRFTGEWVLYNILELKFLEGHKVRDVALRLAMSEADLYRKQRVAIEVVAHTIRDMESKAKVDAG